MDNDRDFNTTNRTTNVYEPTETRRSSNSLAYLIGGLVLALGLLAFLFYDGGTDPADVSTTSSTTQSAPASPGATTGTTTGSPAGSTGTTGSTTGTAPPTTAPAAPATAQ